MLILAFRQWESIKVFKISTAAAEIVRCQPRICLEKSQRRSCYLNSPLMFSQTGISETAKVIHCLLEGRVLEYRFVTVGDGGSEWTL